MGIENTSIVGHAEVNSFRRQSIEGDGDGFILLRPEVVATMLGLSKPRVYQLARQGEIPSVKIGKSTRFFRDDVKKFILSRLRNGESS